jgi:hypothetical protein
MSRLTALVDAITSRRVRKPPPPRQKPRKRARPLPPPDYLTGRPPAPALRQHRYAERNVLVPLEVCEAELACEVVNTHRRYRDALPPRLRPTHRP